MIRFFVFLCLAVYSDQRSTPQDASYVAAVVEYQIQATVEDNIRAYEQLVADAAAQNADIIVFPEMTLTRGSRAIPVPMYGDLKTNPVPALVPALYDEVLENMSLAARQHQIYVVVNVQERLDCRETHPAEEYCPEEKNYLFNTNVAFDRNGAVIDRYRKINLFGEFSRTPALRPELGIFTTDFGVTFGQFICFDLMFQVPAVQVVEKENITDVIFSTMWFSELPYLTAVEIQESYAYSMNINFLAAGANNPAVGSAGSGIYSGKAGALVSTMPGKPTTRLMVSRVPKVPGQVTFPVPGPIYDDPSDHDGLHLIRDPSIPSHITRLLVPGFQEFTLVDKEVSCRFRVRLTQRDGEQTHFYRALVHDGSNRIQHHDIGVTSCSVIACRTDDINTCPYKFDRKDTSQEIEELSIQMTTYRLLHNDTLQCSNIVYYPVSIQSNRFPLEPKKFIYNQIESTDDGREHLVMKLKESHENIMAFGIYGRLYYKDVVHKKVVTEKDVQGYLEFEEWIFSQSDSSKESTEDSNKI